MEMHHIRNSPNFILHVKSNVFIKNSLDLRHFKIGQINVVVLERVKMTFI